MPDPLSRFEGNLRCAGIPVPGWPHDPAAQLAEVQRLLGGMEATPYGPATVLINLPPAGEGPRAWDCTVGTAITGMGRAMGSMVVEDYRGLHALSLAHKGPVQDLPLTWRILADRAHADGLRLRPYWRVSLRQRRLADGNLLPVTEVAVFRER
jgi:hypothetical protein